MVFRGFIQSPQREPSFAENLAKSVIQGVSGSTKAMGQHYEQLSAKKEKALSKLHTSALPYVKQMHGSYLSPDRYRSLMDKSEEFIDRGFHPHEAIDLAAKSLENQRMQQQGPTESGRERTVRELDSMSDSTTPFGQKMGALGTGLLSNIEKFSKDYGLRKTFREAFPEEYKKAGYTPEVSEQIAEQLKEGKTPQEQELINKRIHAGQFLGIEVDPEMLAFGAAGAGLLKLGKKAFGPLWKAAKTMGKEAGVGTEKAAENIMKQAADEGVDVAKAMAGDAEEIAKVNSLANRISKEVPESATQMRMSRLSPESKLYKTGEQQKIYHEQLKSHPKYAAEIAADAEARNARLNRTVGEKSLGTRSVRMARAQMELPQAVEGYRKAAGRVRALEEEIAKLPAQQTERMATLLEVAKNELRDAESYAKNMLANTKTGESWQVGFKDMREAAQKKMLDIENKIADGEEVKLALADYNPKWVKEGKELAKKKPVPSSRTEDFYTQVHDEYANEYAKRIQALNAEIAKPAKSLSEGQQKARYIKERAHLQNMIDSHAGENAVHRRKMGLREMEQRKLASDRLKSTTKPTEAPHIESAARPKIDMAERAREGMKTAEGRAKLADEVVEEAAQDAPKAGEKIRAEKEKLNDALDEVAKAEEKAKSGSLPKDEKSAKGRFKQLTDDLLEVRDSLKKGDLSFFKTRIGTDFGKAVIAESLAQASEYYDLPRMPYASMASVMWGDRGKGYRAVFSWMLHTGINKIKKENYKSALRNYESDKIYELKNRYSKSLIKDAEKEFMSS